MVKMTKKNKTDNLLFKTENPVPNIWEGPFQLHQSYVIQSIMMIYCEKVTFSKQTAALLWIRMLFQADPSEFGGLLIFRAVHCEKGTYSEQMLIAVNKNVIPSNYLDLDFIQSNILWFMLNQVNFDFPRNRVSWK